ncbi:MAG TPA: glycosyltransferase family 9 protein [Verrucomicrobiae bacterium]|nr:glycosyltransferase family 9 protein [Verrucomicrobiae bacterium]
MRTLILSRPDRIGDVVISTSCLAPIREKFPEAKIFFVAAERMRPLLENHPLLAGFIPVTADLIKEFQRLDASAIVHLHPNQDCYVAASRAGVPMRIGYPVRFLNRHLTHKIEDRRKEGLQHEAAYNFDLLQALDVALPKQLFANVHLPKVARETLQHKLPWPVASTPFAVLHPSAHSKIARWPAERFASMAESLKESFGFVPVFIGAGANDFSVSGMSSHLNLSGQTDLGELGWLLKHARVLVTNDSGPAHLAAAVGCPVVSIFGRTAPMYGPARWRPLSERAVIVIKPLARKRFEGRDAHWRRCFAAIELEEVKSAVRQALGAETEIKAFAQPCTPEK